MGPRPEIVAHRTKSDLRGLSPLLGSWVQVLRDFCAANKFEDNPWWYNERASLSMLAAAAWRLNKGWTAIEEFSTEKRGVVPGKKIQDGRVVRGRCDLYVAHQSTDFAVEAKQVWLSTGAREPTKRIDEAMQRARRDAGNLTASEATFRLGAAFTVPYISPRVVNSAKLGAGSKLDLAIIGDHVKAWIGTLELEQYDAFAYYFPRNCSEFVGRTGRLFPGALLTFKVCKTGTRRKR